jgi:hypothetical protein
VAPTVVVAQVAFDLAVVLAFIDVVVWLALIVEFMFSDAIVSGAFFMVLVWLGFMAGLVLLDVRLVSPMAALAELGALGMEFGSTAGAVCDADGASIDAVGSQPGGLLNADRRATAIFDFLVLI